jgi:hypothetical protein
MLVKRKVGRPFTKGKTGNPGGRPKFSKLSIALRAKLASCVPNSDETYAEAFARILCKAGLRGDRKAIEFISARAEGYPVASASLEITTPEVADDQLPQRIADLINRARELSALRDGSEDELELRVEDSQPLLPPAASDEES